jgi:ADP-heptose:LPS heptosyltransferase
MLGKGFLKQPASDPVQIQEACAQAQRVLLCMPNLHIGNFAVSTPAIKALQRGFGGLDKAVDVIVARSFMTLARQLLDPANLIPHDMPRSFAADLAGLMRTRRQTRGNYDLLISFSGNIRSTTLARFAGAGVTIGFDRYRRSGLYNLRIEDRQPAHVFGRYAQFGVCVGGAEPVIEPFTPLDGDAESLGVALRDAGIDPDNPMTLFHHGAGKPHRRCPIEQFAKVADHVIEQHGHAVGILTPPGEERETNEMLAAMNNANRAHRISVPLGQLLPLFDHAQALVCNESGPMHLAAMTRCAIVALYGPTDPARWSPIRTGQDVAVLRGDTCKDGCAGGNCVADGACMTSITTDSVIEALDRTLESAIAGTHKAEI